MRMEEVIIKGSCYEETEEFQNYIDDYCKQNNLYPCGKLIIMTMCVKYAYFRAKEENLDFDKTVRHLDTGDIILYARVHKNDNTMAAIYAKMICTQKTIDRMQVSHILKAAFPKEQSLPKDIQKIIKISKPKKGKKSAI